VTCDDDGGSAAGSGATSPEPCDIIQTMPYCYAGSLSAAILHEDNLLVVLDRSSGMNSSVPGSTQSRWDAMMSALDTVLNRSRNRINFGLDLFPAADVSSICTGDACCAMPALSAPPSIPVGPGIDTVPEILNALGSVSPGGGAPAAAALARALDYYTIGDGKYLCGDKYVLLATEGGPNCNTAAVPACDASHCTRNLDPQPDCDPSTNCCNTPALAINCLDDQSVVSQIQALQAAGVRTIVAGLSSSDPYAAHLNAFANAGGQAQPGATAYYAVAESAGVMGLAAAVYPFTIYLVMSCVIAFDTPPQDPDSVSVLVDCEIVPREPADGGDGSYWMLDMDARTITIGGPACEKILNEGVDRVDYVFGCATGGP
jgi:hypothetical protein